MLRVVLDANVLISALLSPRGSPAELLRRSVAGAFDLVVSPVLVDEVERALAYPRLAERVGAEAARAFAANLRRHAILVDDPSEVEPGVTGDPGDDYLVALARVAGANVIVSGDEHVISVVGLEPPVLTPRAFLELLERGPA